MSVVTVTILSEGKAIDMTYQLLSVQVNHEVNRIPYAELVFIDGDASIGKFTVSDTRVFEPGKEIQIKLRYEDKPSSEKVVFTGIVVRHGVSVEHKSSTLTILMKDAAVVMTQGKNNTVFTKMSDDEIIKKILSSHGLKTQTIASTKITHAEMVQYASSDWDFILARAESNSLLLTVESGAVSAQLIKSPSSPKATLEYGIDEIFNFDIEVDAQGQYKKISASAWSIKDQAKIMSEKSGNLSLSPGNLNSQQLARKEYALTTSVALGQTELTAWTEAKLARAQLSLIRGCLAVSGRADLQLLDTLEIKGIGQKFNGKALITGISHRVTDGSWITDLQFGLEDKWLLQNDNTINSSVFSVLPNISGLHIGIVSGFEEDPDKELRVRIKLSSLNDTSDTVWARLASPDAGKERGYFFRPEAGDEVIVGFINNDPRQAIILGALYSSKNPSPECFGAPNENNSIKGIASKKGLVIGFDDEKTIVYIETPGKNSITLDDNDKKIEVKDQHGNSIVMDDKGITLKSAKDLKFEASGNVEIKGSKVDIK